MVLDHWDQEELSEFILFQYDHIKQNYLDFKMARILEVHKRAMMNFMRAHPALAFGHSNDPSFNTPKKRDDLKKSLAAVVNAAGEEPLHKSAAQAFKSWRDWVGGVMARADELQERANGAELFSKLFTSIEQELIRFLRSGAYYQAGIEEDRFSSLKRSSGVQGGTQRKMIRTSTNRTVKSATVSSGSHHSFVFDSCPSNNIQRNLVPFKDPPKDFENLRADSEIQTVSSLSTYQHNFNRSSRAQTAAMSPAYVPLTYSESSSLGREESLVPNIRNQFVFYKEPNETESYGDCRSSSLERELIQQSTARMRDTREETSNNFDSFNCPRRIIHEREDSQILETKKKVFSEKNQKHMENYRDLSSDMHVGEQSEASTMQNQNFYIDLEELEDESIEFPEIYNYINKPMDDEKEKNEQVSSGNADIMTHKPPLEPAEAALGLLEDKIKNKKEESEALLAHRERNYQLKLAIFNFEKEKLKIEGNRHQELLCIMKELNEKLIKLLENII